MTKQIKRKQQHQQATTTTTIFSRPLTQYLSDHIFSIVAVIRNVTTTNNRRITKATNNLIIELQQQ